MKKILACVMAAILLAVGSLSIYAANIYGDVYTDGKITTKDTVKLAQYIAGWGIKLTADELAAADVHADGKINTKDAVKIAQFIAGWDVVLGDGPSNSGSGSGSTNDDNEIQAGDAFN